jgi:hypothetical protein
MSLNTKATIITTPNDQSNYSFHSGDSNKLGEHFPKYVEKEIESQNDKILDTYDFIFDSVSQLEKEWPSNVKKWDHKLEFQGFGNTSIALIWKKDDKIVLQVIVETECDEVVFSLYRSVHHYPEIVEESYPGYGLCFFEDLRFDEIVDKVEMALEELQ